MGGKSYPIPIRVLSFEGQYQARDPRYDQPAVDTAAVGLRQRFSNALASARRSVSVDDAPHTSQAIVSTSLNEELEVDEEQDTLATYEAATIEAFKNDHDFLGRLNQYGIPWRGVQEQLKNSLPDVLSDRDKIAYQLVPKAMSALFGEQEVGWTTEKRPSKSGSKPTTWVVVIQGGSSQ